MNISKEVQKEILAVALEDNDLKLYLALTEDTWETLIAIAQGYAKGNMVITGKSRGVRKRTAFETIQANAARYKTLASWVEEEAPYSTIYKKEMELLETYAVQALLDLYRDYRDEGVNIIELLPSIQDDVASTKLKTSLKRKLTTMVKNDNRKYSDEDVTFAVAAKDDFDSYNTLEGQKELEAAIEKINERIAETKKETAKESKLPTALLD